jgi:hypothetical protein
MSVTLDIVLDNWIYWPLIRTTRNFFNFNATDNLHNSQITKAPDKIFHPAVSSPAVPWQRLLAMENLQFHVLKSSLNGDSLQTTSLPQIPAIAPIVFSITALHRPSKKNNTVSNSTFIVTCVIRCRGNVFTEMLPRNGFTCYNIKTDLTEK